MLLVRVSDFSCPNVLLRWLPLHCLSWARAAILGDFCHLSRQYKDYSMLLMTETSADLLFKPYQNQNKGLWLYRNITSRIRANIIAIFGALFTEVKLLDGECVRR